MKLMPVAIAQRNTSRDEIKPVPRCAMAAVERHDLRSSSGLLASNDDTDD